MENLLIGILGILVAVDSFHAVKVPYSARNRDNRAKPELKDKDFKIDIAPVVKVYFDNVDANNEVKEEEDDYEHDHEELFKSMKPPNPQAFTIDFKDLIADPFKTTTSKETRFKFLGNSKEEYPKETRTNKKKQDNSEDVSDISFQTSTKFYSNESSSSESSSSDEKSTAKTTKKKINSKTTTKKEQEEENSKSINKDLANDNKDKSNESIKKKSTEWSGDSSGSNENFKRVKKKPIQEKEKSDSFDWDDISNEKTKTTVKEKKKRRKPLANRKPQTTTTETIKTEIVKTTSKRTTKAKPTTNKPITRPNRVTHKRKRKRPKTTDTTDADKEKPKHKLPSHRNRYEQKVHKSNKTRPFKKKKQARTHEDISKDVVVWQVEGYTQEGENIKRSHTDEITTGTVIREFEEKATKQYLDINESEVIARLPVVNNP